MLFHQSLKITGGVSVVLNKLGTVYITLTFGFFVLVFINNNISVIT